MATPVDHAPKQVLLTLASGALSVKKKKEEEEMSEK